MISYKSLTKAQQDVVDTARKLEARYGVGTVFIDYETAMKRYCFKIHKKGAADYSIWQVFINQRTRRAMENAGLLENCDSQHNTSENAAYCKNGLTYIGCRVRTECIGA